MDRVIALLIPITGIVMGVGLGMLGMYLEYRKRKEIYTLYHQERMAAIDKGLELPPLPEAFFTDSTRPRSPRGQLLKGLIWLFTGSAVTMALFANAFGAQALYGLIFVALGAAYLVNYFAVGKRQAEMMEAAEKAKLAETNQPLSV